MVGDSKYAEVFDLIMDQKDELCFTDEDEKKLTKLLERYHKKTGSNSSKEVVAGAILWTYSKINFLWEDDALWSQKHIAELLLTKQKTISNKSRDIINALKIRNWDERFCRKEVYEDNPMSDMVVVGGGLIVSRAQAIPAGGQFVPLNKTKEDYFYEGIDSIGIDDARAIRCFKKAIELDDEYVDGYNGIGELYFSENPGKAKEYYKKAFDLSLKHFNGVWPKKIEWGVLENRRYLRALQGYGLVLWREGKSEEAMVLFKLMLKVNKDDNQGIRYLVAVIYAGLSWDDMDEFDEDDAKCEAIFWEQNKKHKFFEFEG